VKAFAKPRGFARLVPLRRVLLLLAGAAVLGTSGCGGSASPAGIVHGDLSRVGRAFSGWKTVSYSTTCRDTAGGPPAASANGSFIYPPKQDGSVEPYRRELYAANRVDIAAEYRSTKRARLNIAGFATARKLGCRRAADLATRYGASGIGVRPSTVSFVPIAAATIPGWLSRAVGPQVQGYHELLIPPFGWPRVYGMLFAYSDPKDPHVTYRVSIRVASPTGRTEDPTAYRALKREALRLVNALN
jgi:hypothetical protein